MRTKKTTDKNQVKVKKGFTLIEMLIVIATFAMLAIIATQTVAQSLQSIRKVDATTKVRETADFALSVIERQLRGAQDITVCPNPDQRRIDYTDRLKQSANFRCLDVGYGGYIASSGAILTSNTTEVTQCSFVCTRPPGLSPKIDVSFTIKDNQSSSEEITVATSVVLRSY